MREMARRSENERRDIFRAAAQAMRVHEAIVEKDFWVCWALDYLFQDSPWKDAMAFKGGTHVLGEDDDSAPGSASERGTSTAAALLAALL